MPDKKPEVVDIVNNSMKVEIELGLTVNLGDFNNVRAAVRVGEVRTEELSDELFEETYEYLFEKASEAVEAAILRLTDKVEATIFGEKG